MTSSTSLSSSVRVRGGAVVRHFCSLTGDAEAVFRILAELVVEEGQKDCVMARWGKEDGTSHNPMMPRL